MRTSEVGPAVLPANVMGILERAYRVVADPASSLAARIRRHHIGERAAPRVGQVQGEVVGSVHEAALQSVVVADTTAHGGENLVISLIGSIVGLGRGARVEARVVLTVCDTPV